MQYDDSFRGEARITFSSILLLVIFVSAFALILAAAIWRPWFGDDGDKLVTQPNPTGTAAAEGVPVTDQSSGEQVGAPVTP